MISTGLKHREGLSAITFFSVKNFTEKNVMSLGYFPKIETVSKNNKKGPFSEFYLISRQKGQTSRVKIHLFID